MTPPSKSADFGSGRSAERPMRETWERPYKADKLLLALLSVQKSCFTSGLHSLGVSLKDGDSRACRFFKRVYISQ